jgi:PAS domain S-box-containing protein
MLSQRRGKKEDSHSVLIRICTAVLSQHDTEQITSKALKEIRKAFGAKICWAFLSEEGQVQLSHLGAGKSYPTSIQSKQLKKLSSEILNRSRPVICNRLGELYNRNRTLYGFLRGINAPKFLAVPLKRNGRFIGVLNLARGSRSTDFIKSDLESLSTLGSLLVMSRSKIAEEKSKKSRDFLESIIDNIPYPVFLKDRKHRWVVLNKSAAKLTGYSREQMLGKSDYDFFPQEQADFFWEKDEALFRTGKVIDIPEEPVTDSSGNTLYLHTKKAPLRDSSGRITHLVGIIEDITERKRTGEIAEKERQRLFSVLDLMPAFVYLQAPDYSVPFVNRRFRELFGDPGNRPCYEAFYGRKKPCKPCRTLRVLKTRSPQTWEWPSGNGRTYMVYEDLFPSTDGREMVIGIGVDITEHKRMEKALVWRGQITSERARLLTDLRTLDRTDQILTRVCQAVRDSGLFQRAVMTLHEPEGNITHLGQVGLLQKLVKQARQAPPISREVKAKMTNKRFRISDSFFIPEEAGLDLKKSRRHIPQKKVSLSGDWKPGDELFVPLRDFSGKVMGYLSVDTPTNGHRPDLTTIQALEMMVEAAASRIREVEIHRVLRKERDFSRSILEAANSMVVCLDADANITVFNRECERVTGFKKEEVLGKRWPDLFLPIDKQHAGLKSFTEWVRAHPRDQYEGSILTKSGEARTILWSNTAILGPKEKDVVAIAIGHDITERKRTEQVQLVLYNIANAINTTKDISELFKSIRQELSMILDTTNFFIALYDKQTDTISCPYHVDQKDQFTFLPAKKTMIAYVIKGGKPLLATADVKRKLIRSGKIKPIGAPSKVWLGVPLKIGREVIGALVVQSYTNPSAYTNKDLDILQFVSQQIALAIERKRAEETLRESELQYHSTIDSIDDPIHVVDTDLRFVIMNKAFERWNRELGFETDVIGRTIFEVYKFLPQKVRDEYQQVIDTGKILVTVDSNAIGGQEIITETRKIPVFEGKRSVRIITIIKDITERKRAEDALRESEEKIRALLNAPHDISLLIDTTGKIEALSQYTAKKLGGTINQLIGMRVYDFFEPEIAHRRKAACDKVLKTGKPTRLEDERAGNWFDANVYPVFDEQGKVIKFAIFSYDITERKRAEQALKESEERYKALFDRSLECMYLHDFQGNFLDANPAALNLLGYSKKEIKSIDFATLLAEDQITQALQTIQQVKKTGFQEKLTEYRLRHKNGSFVDVETKASLIYKDGKPYAIQGIARDITERKAAEKAIKESEEKYRLLVENQMDMVVRVDPEGRFLFVSPSYCETFGKTEEELLGNKFMPLVHEEDREKTAKAMENLYRPPYTCYLEQRALTKFGWRWLAWADKSVLDENDNVVAIVGVGRDITDKKRAEEALERQEEMYRTLVETAQEGIGIIDPKENLVFVNQALAGLLEYPREELLGKNIKDISTETQYKLFRDQTRKLKKGKSPKYEINLITSKGKSKSMYISTAPLWKLDGSFTGNLVVVSDLTEVKKAKEYNILLNASKSLSRTLDFDRVLALGAEKITQTLGADHCVVMLLEDGSHGSKVAIKQLASSNSKGTFDTITGLKTSRDQLASYRRSLMADGFIQVSDIHSDVLPELGKRVLRKSGMISALIVPIFLRNKLLGIFHVGMSKEPRTFYPDQIQLALTMTNQTGVALQNCKLMQDLQRDHSKIKDQTKLLKAQYREQKMMFELTQALSSARSLDELQKSAAKKVVEMLNTERSTIGLVNPDGKSVTIRKEYVSGGKGDQGVTGLSFSSDLFPQMKKILIQKQPQLFPDITSLPQGDPVRKYLFNRGIKSLLVVPLISRGNILGLLTANTFKEVHHYSKDEIRLLKAISNPVAVAIENHLLMEDLKQNYAHIEEQATNLQTQTREKDILLKVSQSLSKAMSSDEVSQVASRVVGSAMAADRCAVLLSKPESLRLELRGLYSKDHKSSKRFMGKEFSGDESRKLKAALRKRHPFVFDLTSRPPDTEQAKSHWLGAKIQSALAAGMFFGEKLVGVLSISTTSKRRTFTPGEIKLIQTIANQIAVAVENARLLEMVQKHAQDLKDLTSQLIKIQEDERRKMAKELHDQLGQMLQAMMMNLDHIRKKLKSKPEKLENIEDDINDTRDLLKQTIEDVRTLSYDLRPPMLVDFGLVPTLKWYIENFSQRANINVSLKVKDKGYRFPPQVELTLYRIVQEALTNVAKHSGASEVIIRLSKTDSTATLSVRDNGIGFDPDKVLSAPKGMGLFNMKERVNLLGGSFDIISQSKKGTTLTFNIPFSEVKHEEA